MSAYTFECLHAHMNASLAYECTRALQPGEHLQLTHAETMFLAHSLGVLRLEDGAGREISAVRDLWQSFVGRYSRSWRETV